MQERETALEPWVQETDDADATIRLLRSMLRADPQKEIVDQAAAIDRFGRRSPVVLTVAVEPRPLRLTTSSEAR